MSDEVERQGFSCVWKIENFSHCLEKTNEPLESLPFLVEGLSSTEWRLLLYPRGADDQSRIAFYLQREGNDGGPLGMTVDFELSFLSTDGSVLKMAELNEHCFEAGDGYGIPAFVSRDEVLRVEKDKYLPEGTLTARCRLWKCNSSLPEDGECVTRTRIGVEKGSFKWDIRDFSNLQASRQTTLVVERASKHDSPLSVALYLSGGYLNDRKVQIDITLGRVSRLSFCTCRVSVLDARGRALDSSEDERWFQARGDAQVWQLRPFLTKSYLLSKKQLYLPKDVLSLEFEFCLSVGVQFNELEVPAFVPPPSSTKKTTLSVNAATQANPPKHLIPSSARTCSPLRSYTEFSDTFVHDLHCLYDEKLLSDFTFRAGAELFPVHRCVLGARSPVFRAMFTSDMSEQGKPGHEPLDIPDLDAETMHHLLTFIYTDGVEDVTWEGAYKLYSAADKYAIPSLKRRCASSLALGLTVGNVCQMLALAEMRQDGELKAAAQQFVLQNDATVLRSEEWRGLEAGDADLAIETMREVYLRKLQI